MENQHKQPSEPPAMTPAVARPYPGGVIVLAVGEGASDESVASAVEALTAATEGEGVTVVTVRGVEALRMWEPQPAPELATLVADWRKTADSLKDRRGVGDARERNTLGVVIGQVEAILTRPTKPAPELADTIRAYCQQEADEFSAEMFPARPQDMRVSAADILAIVDRVQPATAVPGLAAAMAALATEMHAEAQTVTGSEPDGMPDLTDQVRAQVLHEYASRIRQALSHAGLTS